VVRNASSIEPDWLIELFPDRISEMREVRFDPRTKGVEAVESMRFEGLVLDESVTHDGLGAEGAQLLAEAALEAGVGRFCDPGALDRLRQRIAFAAPHIDDLDPLTDDVVAETLRNLCEGRRSFADLEKASLIKALRTRLPHRVQTELELVAPEQISIPGRKRVAVQYESGRPPFVASRLQDFFGTDQGPAVARGQVPLVLHLLAPNQRALQVTTDLAGFWERHYPAIRRELMRRYPKHSWPEDPLTATPGWGRKPRKKRKKR